MPFGERNAYIGSTIMHKRTGHLKKKGMHEYSTHHRIDKDLVGTLFLPTRPY